jgi:hypothetical protein
MRDWDEEDEGEDEGKGEAEGDEKEEGNHEMRTHISKYTTNEDTHE